MILLLRAALILATSGFVRKKADSLFSLSQESEKFFFQVFKVSEHLMWPHTYFSHFFLSNNSSSLSYKDAKSTVPLAPELEKKKKTNKKRLHSSGLDAAPRTHLHSQEGWEKKTDVEVKQRQLHGKNRSSPEMHHPKPRKRFNTCPQFLEGRNSNPSSTTVFKEHLNASQLKFDVRKKL